MITNLVELIAEARVAKDYNRFIAAIPYMNFLGVSVRDTEQGPLCVLPASPKFIGNPRLPALHGGVVSALLEIAAITQLIWAQDSEALPKTIDINIDYLHSAKPVETYARGIVTKHGRRVANVRAEAWQDDPARPVAAAHAHFLLT